MIYIQGITDFKIEEPTAVTLGKFDGMHRGHQKLVKRIRELESSGVKSTVFSLNKNRQDALLTSEEQRMVIEKMEVSYLVDCPFLPEISRMEPEEFIRRILVEQLNARYIVVGNDFRFGYNRAGDSELLKKMQEFYGFRVEVLGKEQHKGQIISSTYIKQALDKGNMELVNDLLGYPYFIAGEVLHGRHMGGKVFGMPTTNLIPVSAKRLPPNGVYVSRTVYDGKIYPGITNIGYKPTIGENFRGVETHIFDFDKDLYGEEIQVELLSYERPEMRFNSVDELRMQMQNDIAFGKEYFHWQ